MNLFQNPLIPFIESGGDYNHNQSFKDSHGNISFHSTSLGNQTISENQLHDQATNFHTLFHGNLLLENDGSGSHVAASHVGGIVDFYDDQGDLKAWGDHLGSTFLIHGLNGQEALDVHHLGNETLATDPSGHLIWNT